MTEIRVRRYTSSEPEEIFITLGFNDDEYIGVHLTVDKAKELHEKLGKML